MTTQPKLIVPILATHTFSCEDLHSTILQTESGENEFKFTNPLCEVHLNVNHTCKAINEEEETNFHENEVTYLIESFAGAYYKNGEDIELTKDQEQAFMSKIIKDCFDNEWSEK